MNDLLKSDYLAAFVAREMGVKKGKKEKGLGIEVISDRGG